MSDWLPIDTAPKDGSTFLAKGVSPVAGRLFAYEEEIGETHWTWEDGWVGGPAYPTHWKPLLAEQAKPQRGCRARLAPGQHWAFCGETDMGQSLPALCKDCGGDLRKA